MYLDLGEILKPHKTMIIAFIIGFILILIIFGYNSLVGKQNQVDNAFASLDAMLKKRFDLIPNLVTTAKNYAQYEQSTLNGLVELRSKAISGQLSNNQTVELDNSFAQATRNLVVLSENYPELRASENYNQLQRALNETEEQISAARRNYNASVTDYNNAVQQIPTNLISSLFVFPKRTLLTTPESQRENVDVNQLFKS
jgi:LemA protein